MSVRSICRVVLLAVSPLIAMNAAAAEAANASPNLSLDVYAKPATLVDIGGERKINLRCAGKGSPTVMLEAGAVSDSMTWYKVQPLAKFTTVCAYDRAGFGFSDQGPKPRNLDAEADDLHALIHTGGIKTPLLLVGHSCGTNIARRYADKYPADLSALVLLDSPMEEFAGQ